MISVSLENIHVSEDSEDRYTTAYVKTDSMDMAAEIAIAHYGPNYRVSNVRLRDRMVVLDAAGQLL